MKTCTIYGCPASAPRNSATCLSCMKKGFQQDGSLILKAGGLRRTIRINAGNGEFSWTGGGVIVLTSGDSASSHKQLAGLQGQVEFTPVRAKGK